jgi:hypothetical protein
VVNVPPGTGAIPAGQLPVRDAALSGTHGSSATEGIPAAPSRLEIATQRSPSSIVPTGQATGKTTAGNLWVVFPPSQARASAPIVTIHIRFKATIGAMLYEGASAPRTRGPASRSYDPSRGATSEIVETG